MKKDRPGVPEGGQWGEDQSEIRGVGSRNRIPAEEEGRAARGNSASDSAGETEGCGLQAQIANRGGQRFARNCRDTEHVDSSCCRCP